MMKDTRTFLLLGLTLLILDQATKYIVRATLVPNSPVPILANIITLSYTRNTGAVFGSFPGTNQLLIWITLMVLGLIIFLWDQLPHSTLGNISLTFIITGSIGNLIDRIFLGNVTDFLDLRFWPVFNLADSLVTIGVIGLILAILLMDNRKPMHLPTHSNIKTQRN